jgi:hypothetical protein
MRTERKYEMRPAVREDTPLLIGLFAPPGGGKTFSALRLASGIQSVYGGDIIVIDTEAGRALHYADKFKFQHIPFEPPFGSLDYLDVIKYAASKKPGVIVIDSMSHEHVGPGGYLTFADAEIDRMAGDDYQKRERVKMASWIKPAAARQAMIQGILQIRSQFVFTFRAKEKSKPIKSPSGKTEIENMGFMPQAGEELLFEMTANCLLLPKSGGVASWKSEFSGEKYMMKLPEQFLGVLDTGKPLSEDIGRILAAWARGGQRGGVKEMQQTSATASDRPAAPLTDLPAAWADWTDEERMIERASKGTKALQAWWATVPAGPKKVELGKKLPQCKLDAQTVDATSS